MGRLMGGALILLFVLLVNTVAAFVEGGTSTGDSFSNCSESGNITECENVGKGSFFSQVADVTFTGIDDLPDWLNAAYIITMGLLLTTAILLIVLAFIPLTNE